MKRMFLAAAIGVAGMMSASFNSKLEPYMISNNEKVVRDDNCYPDLGEFTIQNNQSKSFLEIEEMHCFEPDGNGGYKKVKCPELIIVTED